MIKVMWMCSRQLVLLIPVVVQTAIPDFDGMLKLAEPITETSSGQVIERVPANECFILDVDLLTEMMIIQRDKVGPALDELKTLLKRAIPAAIPLEAFDNVEAH